MTDEGTPPTASAADWRRPRALFYSPDGAGLGHLRRTLAVAGALARCRADADLLALAGSDYFHALPHPHGLHAVLFPPLAANMLAVRRAVIDATVAAYSPDLVHVDTAPVGLGGELAGPLARLHAARPRPALVLGLRDIHADPALTRAVWEEASIYPLLDTVFDQILVYGCRDIFDPVAAYGFSPAAAAKTVFCGYIRRTEPIIPAAEVRRRLGVGDDPLVVVTTGGGVRSGPLLSAALGALQDPTLAGVEMVVVTGPQIADADFAELQAESARLPAVTLIRFTPELTSVLNAADTVVCMGGANTPIEALSLGKRPIVVPLAYVKEQGLRAELLAERGLVSTILPDEATPARLALSIRQELDRLSSPAVRLDFGGLERAGAVLSRLLRSDGAVHKS